MNKLVLALIPAVLACVAVSAQTSPDATKDIVSSYLEIQAHLAADRIDPIKSPARALSSRAKELGKAGEAMMKAAAALEAATDLNAARNAFAPLSDAVIAHVQTEGPEGTGKLRLAYCPMVKRSWLQREEQIRNPYYGSQMLTCGEFKPLKK